MTETVLCSTPPCESTWTVQPDGSLTSTKEGMSRTGALKVGDFYALDVILSNPAFHDGMQRGFDCGCTPRDSSASMTLVTETGPLTADVSGCVFCAPDANEPKAAHAIVSGY